MYHLHRNSVHTETRFILKPRPGEVLVARVGWIFVEVKRIPWHIYLEKIRLFSFLVK